MSDMVMSGVVWSQSRRQFINFAIIDKADGSFELMTTIFGIPGITVEARLTRDGVEFMRTHLIDKGTLWNEFPNQDIAGPWYSAMPQFVGSPGGFPANRNTRNRRASGNGRNGNREYNAIYRMAMRSREQALQRRANSRSRRRASGVAGNARPSVGIF